MYGNLESILTVKDIGNANHSPFADPQLDERRQKQCPTQRCRLRLTEPLRQRQDEKAEF
jgi:hypothetical protein